MESVPAEGEGPKIKGSVMLAYAESKEEVVQMLKNDIYSKKDVWDWEKYMKWNPPSSSSSSLSASLSSLSVACVRLVVMELQHRLHQLDALSLLPPTIRRFLLDEAVPGASLLLVPELTPADFGRLLENPTKASVESWILRGERSVWPAIGALKVRCAVEVELDRGYQMVRRRKPLELVGGWGGEQEEGVDKVVGVGGKRAGKGKKTRRERAASMGGA
ncbi:triacylglycerol lipase [Cryomyces antarcticus]|nr:triacylglycerol lipase [Cryomyces antarcticus]